MQKLLLRLEQRFSKHLHKVFSEITDFLYNKTGEGMLRFSFLGSSGVGFISLSYSARLQLKICAPSQLKSGRLRFFYLPLFLGNVFFLKVQESVAVFPPQASASLSYRSYEI